MFSRRTDWSFEKNPLTLCLEDLKQEHIKVFDLTESNPTAAGIRYPDSVLRRTLAKKENLLYEPQPFGSLKAREAICQMYQKQRIAVVPSQVILTSSTSEAYSFLFRLLLDPDDAVLFPRPSYPLFDFLSQLNDANIDRYPLNYTTRWEMDLQALQSAVTRKTKAIVLVNPNNPTGSFVTRAELAAINPLCRTSDMAIICDEVFADYGEGALAQAVKTLIGNQDALTFVLGGLSKSLGLPQMKLSWIVVSGPQEKVAEALKRLEIIADTYLSVNTPAQNALPAWLLLKDKIQKDIKARVQRNQKILGEFCAKTSLKLLNSDGGWYAILQLSSTINEEAWCCALLDKQHVFVHPGYFFDLEDGAHIVVSLLTPEDIFKEGVRRIASQAAGCPAGHS